MTRDITDLLLDWNDGQSDALEELMGRVYDELRRLARLHMRRERPDHTLQPTALVHETFLRLIDQTRVRWRNRAHFLGVAAHLMRRVTVKHAARHNAAKRGGGAAKVTLEDVMVSDQMLDVEILALEEALARLGELDHQQMRVVELRFYGGLTVEEAAEVLGVSPSTIHREWRLARAWLSRELESAPASHGPRVGCVPPEEPRRGGTSLLG